MFDKRQKSVQKKKGGEALASSLEFIFKLHLYTSKGEALFKATVLAVSWGGGVWHQNTAAAYYLFSISIIMEYAIQLVRAKQFIPKLLPMFLIVSDIIVLVIATGQVIQRDTGIYPFQFYVEVVTLAVIGIDAVMTLLIEPPESYKIEANISGRGGAIGTRKNGE